ncbi:hypothetical protein GCM10027614_11990 [Micromonospora vulcania]
MTTPALVRSRGTLADLLSGRSNGIGLIRLCLAVGVVLSHSKPLGFGANDLGYHLFGRQTNVGTMAVYGFFVLSGLLITRSARRTGLIRYAWHRCLRIFPGLWVCLLITALVVAPLVALREHGTTDGLFDNPWDAAAAGLPAGQLVDRCPPVRHPGPAAGEHPVGSEEQLQRLQRRAVVAEVRDVLLRRGGRAGGDRGAASRPPVRAVPDRRVLPEHRAGLVELRHFSGPASTASWTFDSPLVGVMSFHYIVYLGFLFAFGATLDLYRERVPINDALGIGSALALGLSLLFGGFFAIGLPAFAYLLIWLSVRMPRQLHWVGRKNDYSYGIYIYGFIFQQVMASLGWSRWGYVPFAAMSVAVAFAAAFVSWKLVERPALRLKDWTPGFVARRSARGCRSNSRARWPRSRPRRPRRRRAARRRSCRSSAPRCSPADSRRAGLRPIAAALVCGR